MHARLGGKRQGQKAPGTGTGTPVKRLPTPLPGPNSRPLCVRGPRNMTVHGDTRWPTVGPNKTPRQRENSQLAGRFRRWWQVLGSNQRRLSRRFYRPSLLEGSNAADPRVCGLRHGSGPPPSAMRPCDAGSGGYKFHGRARTPRVGAVMPTVLPVSRP
jgi:hypothetical protein